MAALIGLIIADVVENVLARGVQAPDVAALTRATAFKGALLITLVVIVIISVIVRTVERRAGAEGLGPTRTRSSWVAARAIMVHRLSLLPTVALLVLSVAAGTPLLEQLPDVQRSWTTRTP